MMENKTNVSQVSTDYITDIHVQVCYTFSTRWTAMHAREYSLQNAVEWVVQKRILRVHTNKFSSHSA